jgi:hypothetical protein
MAGPVRPPSRGSGPHGAPLISYEALEMMRKVQVKEIGGTTSSPGLPSSSRCSASPPGSGPDLRQLCLDQNFAAEKSGGVTLSFRDLGSLLPITITVASAIVLFIIKEVLDFIKIRRSDGRKKVAIRTLIAKECEINYDITRVFDDILRHINVWISSNDIEVKVENLVDGRKNLIISIERRYFSYIMSKSHKSILEKNLLDIAVLDKNLFEKSATTLGIYQFRITLQR